MAGEPCVFSVIIPTFNRAYVVGEAIASALAQDTPGVEVIVVDDGSTDATASLVAEHGDRVTYVRQQNRGPAAARNRGLELATGRFVCFLDSDDVWLPGKLRAELELFESRPEVDAVITDCERWNEGELETPSWFGDQGLGLDDAEVRDVPMLPPIWVRAKLFATCCLTLRRAAIRRMVGDGPLFDVDMLFGEDWVFGFRVHRWCTVVLLSRCTARVRRFEDGTRVGRPGPGVGASPRERQVKALQHYRALGRGQDLPGWPAPVLREFDRVRGEAARRFAANLRGWQRSKCLSVTWRELVRGSLANAAAILRLGLLGEPGPRA